MKRASLRRLHFAVALTFCLPLSVWAAAGGVPAVENRLAAVESRLAALEAPTVASQGVVRCGANHFTRAPSGVIPELHYTALTLRNIDPATHIKIERIRMFKSDGTVFFDTGAGAPMPESENGLLGPTNDIIGPTQVANLVTRQNFGIPWPGGLDSADRPMTFEVSWSSATPALLLRVSSTRDVRALVGTSQKETRARSSGSCNYISWQ